MNKTDKILIIVGTFLAVFIIACFVLFCIKQVEPQALIMGVLGAGGLEGLLCAVIKVNNIKKENTDEVING